MPLGRIDFANAPTFDPVEPGSYEGYTDTWEAKQSSKGDSTNIEARFKFNYTDPNGNEQTRTITKWWNLKKEALAYVRRDLVNMGADPADFQQEAGTDLEGILNSLFSQPPTPVTLVITQQTYTPPEGGEGQLRNQVSGVKAREEAPSAF